MKDIREEIETFDSKHSKDLEASVDARK